MDSSVMIFIKTYSKNEIWTFSTTFEIMIPCGGTFVGGSPDQESVGSGTKRSGASSGARPQNRKEFLHKFVDSKILTRKLEDWFESISEKSACKNPVFDVPFELIELQKFDYALEGVPFQQLIRMPNAVYASTSDAVEATAYLAIEDFLHASVKGLWEAFWSQDEPMPFSVACLYNASLKFYQAEKAIANGKLGDLCATVESDQQPSPSVLGEALFFAVRMLLSRSLSRLNGVQNSNCVFVLLIDSQYGGVVKIEGDISKLECDVDDIYESAAEWIKKHSRISVSPIDRIWNKLGNANWGDIGALQVLFATFHCIMQFAGIPKHSIEDLAADHGSRLQTRRVERQLGDTSVNGGGLFRFQQRSVSPEIVEVQEEAVKIESEELMKLEEKLCFYMLVLWGPVWHPYFVIIGWGHAILEERDRPAMNLHFSSTYALQEGKLCSASDAESLVYLLYFSCGGLVPDLDSVEGALHWRETSWSRRLIQQKLGDVSTVLKAFADYVDSLCGTPYPMDYDIWLRRLRRNIHEEDHGKEIDTSG
ncbi:unnamed protein product, partial [Vitis vinifera]